MKQILDLIKGTEGTSGMTYTLMVASLAISFTGSTKMMGENVSTTLNMTESVISNAAAPRTVVAAAVTEQAQTQAQTQAQPQAQTQAQLESEPQDQDTSAADSNTQDNSDQDVGDAQPQLPSCSIILPVGSLCDMVGTVLTFAGLQDDGQETFPLYVQDCDEGFSLDGAACSGSHTIYWSNGIWQNYTPAPTTQDNDGTDVADAGNPNQGNSGQGNAGQGNSSQGNSSQGNSGKDKPKNCKKDNNNGKGKGLLTNILSNKKCPA